MEETEILDGDVCLVKDVPPIPEPVDEDLVEAVMIDLDEPCCEECDCLGEDDDD
jgi:hypothetical protein